MKGKKNNKLNQHLETLKHVILFKSKQINEIESRNWGGEVGDYQNEDWC